MKSKYSIDLLNQIIIDIQQYQEEAGWDVFTDIPEGKLNKPIKIKLKYWFFDEDFKRYDFTKDIEVKASVFLDVILSDLIRQIRAIPEEEGGLYFIDHRWLEIFTLNTRTMVADVGFGS